MSLTKKGIYFLMVLTMLTSVMSGMGQESMFFAMVSAKDGAALAKFTAVDGSVMFEAEDATINQDLVQVISDNLASNKKAVDMNVNHKEIPSVDEAGGIAFEFQPDKKGSYYVWMRYARFSDSANNGSSYLSLNGAAYKFVTLPVSSTTKMEYTWMKYANFGALEAGKVYNFRMMPRESGTQIDKFIVTSNSNFIPMDMGSIPKEGEIIINKLDENKYPKPSITPPPEHPRLLLRKSDIPIIQENLTAGENKNAEAAYRELLANEFDGNLPEPTREGTNTYSATLLGVIEAKAFEYALNGDETYGKQAVAAIKNYIKTCTYEGLNDYTRAMGQVIFTASEVYDWCYPLLTKEDKEIIVSGCQMTARGMEIGWPPSGQGTVAGHGGEAQLQRDLLSLGIAAYDEFPDIYNFVAGRYFDEFIEPREFWSKSNKHHQGDSYGAYRYMWDLWGQLIIQKMSGQMVYSDDMRKVAYQFIYGRRPDGQTLREGDCYTEKSSAKGGFYYKGYAQPMFFAANNYHDPYLNKEVYRGNPGLQPDSSLTAVQILIFNDPGIGVKPYSELPLTKYFPSPAGQMIARTGWNDGLDAPDVIAFMKIGEMWAGNHDHLDAGNFQIYYKGILASESGYYDSYASSHDSNYNKETIAHNSLLIYDPNEDTANIANSGGQRRPASPNNMEEWIKGDTYKTGEVLGQEFGPDPVTPEYTYIKGDITKAYSDKVKEVLRSMIFLPLKDENHKAAFVVLDKVTASNKEFKKTFLLHSQQEPQIDGNVTVIKRDTDGYNGMLTNQTLLPKEAKIEKIGGPDKEFWVNGKNYPTNPKISPTSAIEAGWGRVEIAPAKAAATDYFLNVMYVNDADQKLPLEKAELIETDQVAGTKIFDHAVIFTKNAKRIDKEFSFKIEGSEPALQVNVAGLKEGTWSISVNGKQVTQSIATKDGGVIYFEAPAGECKLTYVSAASKRSDIPLVTPTHEGIDISIANKYIYSDVAPTIVEGRTLVPMRVIFEKLNAAVKWDDATRTATAKKDDIEIKITEDSKMAMVNGKPVTLDVAATIINGRFLVPVRFVSEALGAKVEWDEFSMCVNITPGKRLSDGQAGVAVDGYATIINSTCSEEQEQNPAKDSWDMNNDTLWAANGEQWVIYELDGEYTISGVEIMFNQNKNRDAVFEVEYSMDGVNFSPACSGHGDGQVAEYTYEKFPFAQSVKAKFIKYIGKGSNISMWNGVREIRFKVAE